MKSEMRKITIEQEVFVAFDGTEFTDEDDCTDYEIGLKLQRFQMLDHNFRLCSSVEECQYVNLKTKEDVEEFIDICVYIGIDCEGLDRPGVYMYYYHGDSWTNISEIIEKFDEREDNISGN